MEQLNKIKLAAIFAVMLSTSSCVVSTAVGTAVDVASTAVGTAVDVTTGVVGGAVDLATGSEEEENQQPQNNPQQ